MQQLGSGSTPTATGQVPEDSGDPAADGEGVPPSVPPTTPAGRGAGRKSSADGLTAADRGAGLRSAAVPESGAGPLLTVAGDARAPGDGQVRSVRVQVEKGLDVDGATFARFVMATLNDDRSWGHGGRMTFARTDGPADIRVVLASPETSADLCSPLRTGGRLSCRNGNAAVITLYRWVKATQEYSGDRTGYRRYVINHEVGHVLGHGHEACPGKGKVAPVMMQQTKGLLGCRPNSWPFP